MRDFDQCECEHFAINHHANGRCTVRGCQCEKGPVARTCTDPVCDTCECLTCGTVKWHGCSCPEEMKECDAPDCPLETLEPPHLTKVVADIVVERGAQYGPPLEHWTNTGKAWAALLSRHLHTEIPPIPADVVALFFVIDKAMRQSNQRKRDNLVDICGYAVGADECNERK